MGDRWWPKLFTANYGPHGEATWLGRILCKLGVHDFSWGPHARDWPDEPLRWTCRRWHYSWSRHKNVYCEGMKEIFTG